MLSVRCVCGVLMVSLVLGAPVTENKDAVPKNVKEVQDQEQELQSLLHLADAQAARSDVTVHEEHVQHVHEVNGQKTEVETARKTVSDTETGKVLSDVKQVVSENESPVANIKPEVKVKTEVDVPAEGVHETIVQSGTENEAAGNGGEDETVEFNPVAVAEYLYRTGDFDHFYDALAQLVNESIMTEPEAERYAQMVAMEFDRLQMEEYENSLMIQRRGLVPPGLDSYPAAMDTRHNYPVPMETQDLYPVAIDTPESVYALGQEEAGRPDLELDPADLLPALWNEAYGLGDERADALVRELFAKVRGDNDPDDEGQVRDILLDLVASSLMEDDATSQLGWQPVFDGDAQFNQPMSAQFAPQPMEEEEDKEAAYQRMGEEKRRVRQPTAKQETKLSQQQPIAQQSGSQAREESKARSETKPAEKEKVQAETAKQASSEVTAEKRAAETV